MAQTPPQVLILSHLPSKNFINDLDIGAACTLNKLPNDTTNNCAANQRDLDKLENYEEEFMKINKDKYKVLHLGRNKSRHQHWSGPDWLESSFIRKGSGCPSGQQGDHLVAKEVNVILGCINWGYLSPLFSAGEVTSEVLCLVLSSTVQDVVEWV